MSVEALKAEHEKYCGDPWGCCVDDEFLDRLILEVKAEMPCYDGDGERGWNAELKAYTEVACPTCQARAEKVEA